jgi:hemerythrin-like metal-binding protein
MRIEWNESYLIGEPDIDRQHQHLFELTNQVIANDNIETLRQLVMQLFKHTREHFELEEALMRILKVPDCKVHTEYHNQLLDRLNVISAGIGKGQDYKAELVELMTGWALHHIPESDAVLAGYIRS